MHGHTSCKHIPVLWAQTNTVTFLAKVNIFILVKTKEVDSLA